MSYLSLQKLIERVPSLFKLVLMASERANELNEGAESLVKSNYKKVTSIALEEVIAGKVKIVLAGSSKKAKAKKEKEEE